MTEATADAGPPTRPKTERIVFVVAAVFLGFMVMSVPLAALPIFVHDQLGYTSLTIGQAVLWRSSTSGAAVLGAGLTGCGFSLVFPALGTLAIRGAASMPRGAVLGAYGAFFDLSLALTGPVAGFAAERGGYSAVLRLGAAGAAGAIFITLVSPRATSRKP